MSKQKQQKYPGAGLFWTLSDTIVIVSASRQSIANIPVEFLLHSGDNSWAFVLDIVSLVIEVESGGHLYMGDGRRIEASNRPEAGTYVFKPPDGSSVVQYTQGPQSNRRFAPASGVEEETVSASSRVSDRPEQANFRFLVGCRDSQCLITEADPTSCIACHIVPQSRSDIYQSILRQSGTMFHPASGLFLRSDLHHRYDSMQFSFYLKDNAFYVHFFAPLSAADRAFHGKRIPLSTFRAPASSFPDPRLVRWHYKQCVQAAFRQFSHGMETPSSSASAIEAVQLIQVRSSAGPSEPSRGKSEQAAASARSDASKGRRKQAKRDDPATKVSVVDGDGRNHLEMETPRSRKPRGRRRRNGKGSSGSDKTEGQSDAAARSPNHGTTRDTAVATGSSPESGGSGIGKGSGRGRGRQKSAGEGSSGSQAQQVTPKANRRRRRGGSRGKKAPTDALK